MFLEGLDSLDQKIIQLLTENARMSYSEIGQKIGISRVAVKARIDALEQRGIIEEYTITKTTDELLEEMLAKGFAAAPVLTIDQIVQDEHISGVRNMFPKIEHPALGEVRVTNQAIKMSSGDPEPQRPSPLMGQHNEEILCGELGYTEEKMAELARSGVI